MLEAQLYVTKYNSDGTYSNTNTLGNTSQIEESFSIAIASNEDMFLTGYFFTTLNFDWTGGTDSFTTNGSGQAFFN